MSFNRNNMNQFNPLMEFMNALQGQGNFPPGAQQGRPEEAEAGPSNSSNPWEGNWGWGGPFNGPMPHRGRRHDHEHRGPPGPPPPPAGAHPPPPPPQMDPPSRSPTPPTPPESIPGDDNHPRGPPPPHHGGPRGPHHHSHSHGRRGGPGGPHHRGGPRGGPRGGFPFGGRSTGGGPGFPFGGAQGLDLGNIDLNALAQQFQSHLFGADNNTNNTNESTTKNNGNNNKTQDGSFTPSIDVFDTTSAYIIHASLPGAKKSNIDVSFNAATNAIVISGIISRPVEVDEEMMATLAQDERAIGMFERSVRLTEGVKVDVEGIGAKLEEGVLRVVVPKELGEEWTEVRKVDVE